MEHKTLLQANRRKILETAARYGASQVRVFGSVARGTADDESDIDFLVNLAPDRSLLDLGGLLYELSQILGVDVDVVTEDSLRTNLRKRVLSEAVEL
jgi:predicted nucleotidyltransferase